jgi:hypothetical protein
VPLRVLLLPCWTMRGVDKDVASVNYGHVFSFDPRADLDRFKILIF